MNVIRAWKTNGNGVTLHPLPCDDKNTMVCLETERKRGGLWRGIRGSFVSQTTVYQISFRGSAEHTMREAVTVSREEEGETRGNDRERMEKRERENGRGNEHWFQGENIALFRNRANGYCGPFTGRQAAVSLYLIGWRGGKKRRGWTGGLSIGERWNIPRLCAISVIQGGDVGWRRFFSPSFHLVNFFSFLFFSGLFCLEKVVRGWVIIKMLWFGVICWKHWILNIVLWKVYLILVWYVVNISGNYYKVCFLFIVSFQARNIL